MIFLDGPLRGWPQPHAVGYIKSHHVSYLPENLQSTVGQLSTGQRTPLFFHDDFLVALFVVPQAAGTGKPCLVGHRPLRGIGRPHRR